MDNLTKNQKIIIAVGLWVAIIYFIYLYFSE